GHLPGQLPSAVRADLALLRLFLRPARHRPRLPAVRAADCALAPGAAGPDPGPGLRGAGRGSGGADPPPAGVLRPRLARGLPALRAQCRAGGDRQRGAGAGVAARQGGGPLAALRQRAGAAGAVAARGRAAGLSRPVSGPGWPAPWWPKKTPARRRGFEVASGHSSEAVAGLEVVRPAEHVVLRAVVRRAGGARVGVVL